MNPSKNPFLKGPFTSIWSKNFLDSKKRVQAVAFAGIDFYKSGNLSLYTNVGKNLTKGITYDLDAFDDKDCEKKVFLIYDYFDINAEAFPKEVGKLKCKTSKQYPGFLVDIEQFSDFTDYFNSNFGKRSRYKFKKYRNRLEASFDIRYEMYWGHMEKDEYNFIFKKFRDLLIKRFKGKQVTNNNLNKDEWGFYEEVVYPMILAKEASLYVIYQGNEPIAITLIYFMGGIMIDAITVFDVDFSKFHLGSVMVMKLIEWAFEHKMKILDFSKGDFEYKRHWMTRQYNFYYHIWYDSKHLPSILLANGLVSFFNLKQYIRGKNINDFIHRISYRMRHRDGSQKIIPKNVEVTPIDTMASLPKSAKIDFEEFTNSYLRKTVFDILYLNQLHLNDIQVLKLDGSEEYIVESPKKIWKIASI